MDRCTLNNSEMKVVVSEVGKHRGQLRNVEAWCLFAAPISESQEEQELVKWREAQPIKYAGRSGYLASSSMRSRSITLKP
jgi:hypothetical protein